MAIIDRSYFVGELNIPNKSQAAISSLLDIFITKYEDRFLREILGYELYKAFKAGLEQPVVDQKWTDLIDGIEYTDLNSKLRFWPGLNAAVSGEVVSIENSPIANYVYYWWMVDKYTQSATTGEVKPANENAANVNPSVKLVRAWNEMSYSIGELINYLDAKKTTYPEWEKQDVWKVRRKFRPINQFNI